MIRRRDCFLQSMVNGIEVWLSYATVEYLFATVIPIMFNRDRVLDTLRWRGTVLLFSCYAAWGLVNGLAAAIAMDSERTLPMARFELRVRKLLIYALVITYGLSLLLVANGSEKLTALLGVLLVAGGVARRYGEIELCSSTLGGPAAVSLVLIISSRLAMVHLKDWPALLTVPAVSAAVLVSGCLAILTIGLVQRFRSWNPVLASCLPAVIVIGIVFGPALVSFTRAQIGTASTHSPAEKRLPNIILISMDTVRADHLGIYGYSRQNTPNLQELLRESTLYTRLIAASPITPTSHVSMFTGLYPRSHGVYKQLPGLPMGRPLPQGIPTLASILEAAGYRNIALSANPWFLGPERGMLPGFEHTWTPKLIPLIDPIHPYLIRARMGEFFFNGPIANDFYSSPAVDADIINHRASAVLAQLSKQQAPFFLFLNYMDAHWPYNPPVPYQTMFPGRNEQFMVRDEEDAALRMRVDCGGTAIPSGYSAHVTSQYDGAIAFIDSRIGELIGYLRNKGLYENTLLIITGDHGEGLGDHGTLSHNASMYQDQVHVPLIVKYPNSRKAARVDQLASHVDFLPTILDVAGLAPRRDLPGVSLRQLASIPERTIISERHFGPCETMDPKTPEVQYAVFRGSTKLISSSLGVQELYDLSEDPGEKNNFYRMAAPLELDVFLTEWLRNTKGVRQAQLPIDSETLRNLRSLGYLH
jgi:arylsulfatase A-like enzyme